MNRKSFNQYIRESNFQELFITEMGWNNPKGQTQLPSITVDETEYGFNIIAEKNGFQIILCHVANIPNATICKKIDIKLRRSAFDYICIYIVPDSEHHQWVAPIKKVDKRDLVTIEYETADKADFLFSKIEDLSFGLEETPTIVDVKERIQRAFYVNSEKITKDFYAGFKKEHNAFADFISGIECNNADQMKKDKQWYTSVMLNRLMFCYFIQKKGFLDGDTDYLPRKLRKVQQQEGEGTFFTSFYKGFLCQLFHGGLNAPKHSDEFENIYGRIPYLNGGMFDEHQLEKQYADLDIDDKAFERLFDFFDKWHWHLDTRITASGKDINPDVLGYIFEQYINDRAAMGAYYTKEDITEYIGKNCIIPFLMDETAKKSPQDFKPNGYVWTSLRDSGDRYIYDAVKKGYPLMDKIPEEIAVGIDTTKPDLIERRSHWNEKTPEQFALPTEIWRETIERLQRCDDVLHKITGGEITQINDFITYNLDIRQFAYDLLANTQGHLFVKHFYAALQHVSILDPTCGSGAFLFAAMNILEPLYEVCIDRMQEFHEQNDKLFVDELGEIENKYRSNIQYFIYKSIILRNLYGVDIMVEATEIAKLRLFLKMVAVVEVDKHADNLGLDPLPDIDFNIRCGNTLVGYATEEELNKDLTYGDIFANKEFKSKIEEGMEKVAMTYEHFKELQLIQDEDIVSFKQAKSELRKRLEELNDTLNHKQFLASIGNADADYDKWLKDYQPFNWLAEFYQIINGNKGFDIIIGNPPYVEYSKVKKQYSINNYKTESSGNLYGFIIERCNSIIGHNAYFSMIVPISMTCTQRMSIVQNILLSKKVWLSNYSERPSKLFTGADVALTIFIAYNNGKGLFNTGFTKWKSESRNILFKNVNYNFVDLCPRPYIEPKISCNIENTILKKINYKMVLGESFINSQTDYCLYYRIGGGRYWKIFTSFSPKFILNETNSISSRENHLYFSNYTKLNAAIAILSSSFFYWFFILTTNSRDLNPSDLNNFPISIIKVNDEIIDSLKFLSEKLMSDYKIKSSFKDKTSKKTGKITYQEFYPRLSKNILDNIDIKLAQHYGFTEEELDYIINYDIKYRMGDALNNEEE
ncbi:Eco57I restriction-modification methylase domain-containing protein [Xylanibacter oryzae]|uniref:Eco57I restriction-modification methylase domain-containing protein n=1 Tax=Xylanibacter oryzae TaxID=185293 RepID=UPI0004B61F30|nr:DNA methyltransferase [Xylanibacter oryzae]